jgi:hypothetical protein
LRDLEFSRGQINAKFDNGGLVKQMSRESRSFFKRKYHDLMEALSVLVSAQNPDGTKFSLPVELSEYAPIDMNTTGASAAVAAEARVIVEGVPSDGVTLTVGARTFTFKTTTTGVNDIDRNATDLRQTVAEAINAHADCACIASLSSTARLELTAIAPGVVGNSIPLSCSATEEDATVYAGFGFMNGADEGTDPVEPALPVSLRFSAPGGSVEAGTASNGIHIVVDGGALDRINDLVQVKLVDDSNNAISFVDDGNGGWAIPVKVIP